MKKLFLLIFAAIFMFSCGGGKGSDSNSDSDTEFNDSDCLDCNDGDSGGNGSSDTDSDPAATDNDIPENNDGSDTDPSGKDDDTGTGDDTETGDSDCCGGDDTDDNGSGSDDSEPDDGDSDTDVEDDIVVDDSDTDTYETDDSSDADCDDDGESDSDADSDETGDDDSDGDTDGDAPEECDGATPSSVEWKGKTGTVSVSGCKLRSYTLTTNAPLRWEHGDEYGWYYFDELSNKNDYMKVCGKPLESKECLVSEKENRPLLRSGNTMLDALFALAITELDANKVSAITDYSMNNENPVDCECFETGAAWHYVWTRDTAYAVHSGIAFLEPERSKNSLEFKISPWKDSVGGGNIQIVQDTGSGGSWPVSTDRIVWMLGAYETLKNLKGAEYEAFLAESYEAIKNTLDADRLYVFDEKDGLYRGEQSFLDWREQTYPLWTAKNTKHIGMSKSLSTNVLHFIAMNMASSLAEELHRDADVEELRSQSWQLLQAIKSGFYIYMPEIDRKTFASMKTTFLDYSAVDKRDLLGLSLLILGTTSDIADWNEEMAAEIHSAILEEYPITEAGPSVIFPQEPQRKIYHNRAIWPFVTSYALRAAAKVENDKFYENAFMSLVRGAAFNLSNMENFEFTTLNSWLEDNAYLDFQGDRMSGPHVNSRRQLWSIGGFISMVLDVLFGRDQTLKKIWFSPKIPVNLRNTFFAGSSEIVLKNLNFKGKTIELKIILPPKNNETEGFYVLDSLKLNGVEKTEPFSDEDSDFKPENSIEYGDDGINRIELRLKQTGSAGRTNLLDCVNNYQACWAPRGVENVSVRLEGGSLKVEFSPSDDADSYNIYRDGVKVAENVNETSWVDNDSGDYSTKSYCYSVSAVNTAGWESHHADPACYWGENDNERAQWKFTANHFDQTPTITAANGDLYHGKDHFGDWGRPAEVLSVSNVRPEHSGTYLISLEYASGRPIDTGITSCNKIVKITDENNEVVLEKMVFMPHLGRDDWETWGESSFVQVDLLSSKTYKVEIKDAFNMSYFKHFELYTGGAGGGTEGYNRANISTLKFLLKEIK